jgi:pilus assembly protein FimV
VDIGVNIIFVHIFRLFLPFVIAMFVALGFSSLASALGLGDVRVQSGLGQAFKAQISLVGIDANELNQTCIKARVETTEGVVIAPATVVINLSPHKQYLSLSSRQVIPEPAVKVVVDIVCETQLHREFLILLDPPQFLPAEVAAVGPTPDKNVILPENTDRAEKRRIARVNPTLNDQASENKRKDKYLAQNKLRNTGKPAKDVLKLSEDNFVPAAGLKMSDTLSSDAELKLVENIEDLRKAQAHMAAILRGEDPDSISRDERALTQEKFLALQNDAAQLKRQNQLNKSKLDEISGNSYSRNVVIVLSSIALLGLLIIFALIFYMRRLQKEKNQSWWEQANETKELNAAERRKSIEDIVDDVQASYESVAAGAAHSGHAMFARDLEPAPQDALSPASIPVFTENTEQFFKVASAKARPLSLEETNSSVFNFYAPVGNSLNVEEISDVTQEAEFWMSVNDPQRAIEILEPQASGDHPDSPVPWLYLLDLYAVVKDRQKYESLRERFVGTFNANVPGFGAEPVADGVLQLEDFSHLIKRICEIWNTHEIIPFLQSLLVDDRDGKRLGFELPVYRDILLLIAIAHELERERAVPESAAGAWAAVQDVNGVIPSVPDANAASHPGTIDFDYIDFPRTEMPKE